MFTSMYGMNNQFNMLPFGSYSMYGGMGCPNDGKAFLYSTIGSLLAGCIFAYTESNRASNSGEAGATGAGANKKPPVDQAIRENKDVQEACKFFGTTDYKEALKFDVNKDMQVKEYNERIEKADKTISSCSKTIEKSNKTIEDCKSQIKILENEAGTVNHSIYSLNNNINDKETQIKEARKNDPNVDVSNMEKELSELKKELEKAEKRQKELGCKENKDTLIGKEYAKQTKAESEKGTAQRELDEAKKDKTPVENSKKERVKEIETARTKLYEAVAEVVKNNETLKNEAFDKANGSWITRSDYKDLYATDGSLKENEKVTKAHVHSAALAYTKALPGDKERMGQKFMDLYNKLPEEEQKGSLKLIYEMIENKPTE